MIPDGLLQSIPTTRYQGSKRKILHWLYDCIERYDFHTVLDAFGGSGVVSCMFKRMGKRVTYNDLFKFNQIIGTSIVENNHVVLTARDTAFILSSNSNARSFISDHFRGIYYLDEENRWLDNVVCNIESLNLLYKGSILKYKKAIAYNALFQSCLAKRPYNLFHRKNLEMRTRDVSRGFGNKATWDKSFSSHFCHFIDEINNSVFYSQEKCRSISKNVFDMSADHYDLVYLDPPYLKRPGERNECSDYLKCYHFLEGIANYDQWGSLIDNNKNNKRLYSSVVPNCFKPADAPAVFDNLIKKFSKSTIVLSYRNGGTPSIEELSAIMLRYKKNLDVYDRHYTYALNKQNGDSDLNREFLFIGY